MEDAPLPIIQTPKEEIQETFEIKQKEMNYKLNINIINQEIILSILDEKDLMKEYEIKLTFDELKIKHKIFLTISSSKDFIDFIKASLENKKISIKKNKENQMTIELIAEYLYKQNIITFELNQKKMNFELSIQDLYQKFTYLEMNYKNVIEENKNIKEENNILNQDVKNIKEEIRNLKENNKILKQENQKLNNENFKLNEKIKTMESKIKNYINTQKMKNSSFNKDLISLNKNNLLNSINSTIIEKNEFDMIYSAIEERMNKEIRYFR